MDQLRKDLTANPPLPGSFSPTKGSLCVSKFTDGLWYRAKIERLDGKNAHVIYIDFGNVGRSSLHKYMYYITYKG